MTYSRATKHKNPQTIELQSNMCILSLDYKCKQEEIKTPKQQD